MDVLRGEVEIALVQDRILVTFKDGKVAIVHPRQLRPLARNVISLRDALAEDLIYEDLRDPEAAFRD